MRRAIVACEACPRLRAHCRAVARARKRQFAGEAYWGRPVPGWGDPRARLLVVGLAPAAHGANRTGRMFTGDSSGDWLHEAMHRFGFASRPESVSRDDGLRLADAWVTAAARCAPPGNRPTPAELARCRPFLEAELALLPRLRVVLTLGARGARGVAARGGLAGAAARAGAPALRPRGRERAARTASCCSPRTTPAARTRTPAASPDRCGTRSSAARAACWTAEAAAGRRARDAAS